MSPLAIGQLCAMAAGLSAVSLFQHWQRRARGEALALAMLAAGAMLMLSG